MLVDFEVENFRSYREAKRLSMVASSAKELPQNVIDTDLGLKLVRSAVLYGPNASGKSNLLVAMDWMGSLLGFPATEEQRVWSVLLPFALDGKSAKKPSRFRVRFLIDKTLYDYEISARPWIVEEERLIAYPQGRPQEWFHRKGNEIEFNQTYLKGRKQPLKGMTPERAPLLTIAGVFGHAQLAPLARWLSSNLRDRFESLGPRSRIAPPEGGRAEFSALLCHRDTAFHDWVNRFLRHADLGIQGVEIEVTSRKYRTPVTRRAPDGATITEVQELTQEQHEPFFVHPTDRGGTTRFGLADESHGTRRLFTMLVPLFEALRNGGLLVVDELGASIHPSLIRELIRVFHDHDLNPNGAQLLFTTHDASLLSGGFFRRDQIWFTEKDASGATDLYSLNDIKGVREDESFEKGYLRGRYGAIPFFGSFDFPPVSEEPAETAT